MRREGKENIVVLSVIVLCFAVTLGLCFILGGKGVIGAFFGDSSNESVYAISVGGYTDMTLARTTAELIRQRGGAGYVTGSEEDGIEILYAVYPTEEDAKSVLSALGEGGAYIKQLEIGSSKLKWANNKSAVESALGYYSVTFEKLYELSNSLNGDAASIDDVRNQIKVLSAQISDIKSVFYEKVAGDEDSRITEVKLALITAIALVDNVSLTGGTAAVASSLRYQLVQLVLSRQALMQRI